jgi:hypothetical protein
MFFLLIYQMKKGIDTSGGGAADAPPHRTFTGCQEEKTVTSHLQKPTQVVFKFKKETTKDPFSCNFEDHIRQKIPSVEMFIEVTEDPKHFKVFVVFKSNEDLEKSKSLLKTCQFPFTNKGKTSIWKPEFSVVQPRKSDQKEESADELEPFPLGILGDQYTEPAGPMIQPMNRFLRDGLCLDYFKLSEGKWSGIVKMNVYEGIDTFGIGGYTCVPHPNNPESQAEIVQMQQSGERHEKSKNWNFKGFIYLPKEILNIPDFWMKDWNVAIDDQIPIPVPITLIAPVACHGSRYPVFNPLLFLQSAGECVSGSLDHQSASRSWKELWLKDFVVDGLFNIDDHGRITDLKVRYAQMIEVAAFYRDPRKHDVLPKQILERFETIVTPPRTILINHPTNGIERDFAGNKVIGQYKNIGKVLIPWQLLRMLEVWEVSKRSSTYTSGGVWVPSKPSSIIRSGGV